MSEFSSELTLAQALRPVLPPRLALRRVISKSGMGVYASSDTLYRGAVFGRDSIEVAEDLMTIRRRLVGRIIMTLASLQGETQNSLNEEEPGKIMHEYRSQVVDGRSISGKSREILQELSARWGGGEGEMTYYGSVDATPHFLRMLGDYCHNYGGSILSRKVTLRSGHKISMAIVAENAAEWVLGRLEASQSGLLEYKRQNPRGILNQVWKDSNEFYVHENGTAVNHDSPIASIEVQGLVYDGLLAAAVLLPAHSQTYVEAADRVQQKIFDLLWLPDREYFALGTDYDETGLLRTINTSTANPGALLDTRLFDDIDEEQRQVYITSIIKRIMSPEFLTDAGIRSRSLAAANVVPYWDYHGSFVSWPKETYDFAKGLRRQGFEQLAREPENRLVNIVLKNRDYPEFVYVDQWGRVLSVQPVKKSHADVTLVDSTNNPERTQAWTISAVMAIVASRIKNKVRKTVIHPRGQWQVEFERQLLNTIPRVPIYMNPVKLSTKYPNYSMRLIQATQREAGVQFLTNTEE